MSLILMWPLEVQQSYQVSVIKSVTINFGVQYFIMKLLKCMEKSSATFLALPKSMTLIKQPG